MLLALEDASQPFPNLKTAGIPQLNASNELLRGKKAAACCFDSSLLRQRPAVNMHPPFFTACFLLA